MRTFHFKRHAGSPHTGPTVAAPFFGPITSEEQLKATAFRALNKKSRVLAPAAEATIEYPEFDPCKAVEVVARIHWPAIINMQPTILTHTIHDGDAL